MPATSLTAEARAQLARNRDRIHARIQAAAARAGRDATDIQLIAVTKSVAPEVALELFALGEHDLAENRLPSLDAKLAAFVEQEPGPTWHFIGHLQRNKARRVVERSAVIHSLDSLRLITHVDRIAGELGLTPKVFLQVKLNDEVAKSGLLPSELAPAVTAAREAHHLDLAGLMCMAPLLAGASSAERREAAKQTFNAARELKERLGEPELGLSMGMTGDFEEAITAGSTQVRIGSAFFEGLDPSSPHA